MSTITIGAINSPMAAAIPAFPASNPRPVSNAETRKLLVYLAGPYSGGNVVENVRNAVYCANRIRDMGFVPILPHMSHFWDMITPKPYEYWIKYDFDLIERCDCLLRFDIVSESPGADREEQFARDHGIPVFYDLRELVLFANK